LLRAPLDSSRRWPEEAKKVRKETRGMNHVDQKCFNAPDFTRLCRDAASRR
jgi:hypothetical protein